MKLFFMLLTALQLTVFAAEKSKNDEVDHVALAALLMKDGHYARAAETLNEADTTQKDFDFVLYYTIKGLVFTKQQLYKVANEQFYKAIESGQTEPTIYLYIAQNNFKLLDYQGTIEALDKAGDIAAAKPQLLALRAECHWKLEQRPEALETIAETIARFPDYFAVYKQRFNYYVELGLYQSALEDAEIYLANEKPNAKTYLSFIGALRKSGATQKATELAERGNLKFPESAEMTVMLAHLYLDQEMIHAAADLFDQASIEDAKYTKEAAEMLRRAREFTLALYKNTQLLDTKEKYKQRIAIYLEFGEYERVVSAHSAIERSGLLEDENIRYALAYAYYMTANFAACEAQLKELTRPDLFAKATELRKNIEKCQNNAWECEL
ncbi:hypothetical protein [Sulfurimonas sp. HSL3-7]|uniref:tetratricopeptide repeat protein n=1 Tax=Sulfonitrofixus jiaomeiensis TaxID=3131938 RepID=UPI0031F77CC1